MAIKMAKISDTRLTEPVEMAPSQFVGVFSPLEHLQSTS